MNNVIAETHQGHRVVKLFNGQAQAANRFDAVNRTIVRLSKKSRRQRRHIPRSAN
ncbi:K11085 ATP-binding cassette, subfamily B, bacterial MsbA [Neisseria gonorrhoeae]|uniref:K11085 ATP-binding cassette, subfamily B, bacterial MsbA n=1 Tax=Neisseria gonorrhoeae TaxID=485 RepID=A0A378W0E5_NEIGO|nr:K11085 ATP-binding cassette, subfamily B, bacterial MsbA [Neisseria gonorrhoeae]